MRLGRIPEFLDQLVSLQRLLNDAALNSFASSVNQAHLAESRGVSRSDVLIDDRPDVTRLERVEVDGICDRDTMHGETITLSGTTPSPPWRSRRAR
jgi:hypothetical protein